MAAKKRVSVYSNQHKHIPMTKTEYTRKGNKWVKTHEERETISREQVGMVLNKQGLPFEKSHRLTKVNRYGHSNPYDTFQSISPDGKKKMVWFVDFEKGEKNFSRIVRKSYQDRMRRKKAAK